MALALNNLKWVDMPLNKETKPNQTKPNSRGQGELDSNGNKQVIYTFKISRTGASPPDIV